MVLNYRWTQVALCGRWSHIKCWQQVSGGRSPNSTTWKAWHWGPFYLFSAYLRYCGLCVPRFMDYVSSFNQSSTHRMRQCLKKILAENLWGEATTQDSFTCEADTILPIQALSEVRFEQKSQWYLIRGSRNPTNNIGNADIYKYLKWKTLP